MKPKNCIYPDCLHCTLNDCEYDVPEKEDFNRDLAIDRECSESNLTDKQRRQRINQKRYRQSEKGKAKLREYVENGNVKRWNQKYNSQESAKALARKRSTEYDKRMTQKIGMPYSTFKAYKKNYGITEKDVEKDIVIRKMNSCGRISIPPKIMRQGIINAGDIYKIYPMGNKLIIEKLEVESNEQVRTEKISATNDESSAKQTEE